MAISKVSFWIQMATRLRLLDDENFNTEDEVKEMHELKQWINEGKDFKADDNKVSFKVLPGTDFWQVTHYGFSRTDGNCYVAEVESDACFTVKVTMNYINEFDQAGVMVYINDNNFAKLCVENQLKTKNKLGSVVCKDQRSDWATQVFGDEKEIWFRVSKRGINYLFESSLDGEAFHQMRLFDIPVEGKVSIGVFGASPLGDGFTAEFEHAAFTENQWFLDLDDLPD